MSHLKTIINDLQEDKVYLKYFDESSGNNFVFGPETILEVKNIKAKKLIIHISNKVSKP